MIPTEQRAKRKAGFTLVELIVTLVIIVLIASILTPTLISYIKADQSKACDANRSAILFQLTTIKLLVSDADTVTVQKILDGDYDSFVDDKSILKCPAGGVYTVLADGITIKCSLHDSESSPALSPICEYITDKALPKTYDWSSYKSTFSSSIATDGTIINDGLNAYILIGGLLWGDRPTDGDASLSDYMTRLGGDGTNPFFALDYDRIMKYNDVKNDTSYISGAGEIVKDKLSKGMLYEYDYDKAGKTYTGIFICTAIPIDGVSSNPVGESCWTLLKETEKS